MTRTRLRLAVVSLAVVAVAVSVALSSGRSADPVDAGALGPRLCELARTATTDPTAAGESFMAEVHGPLHEVAATLAERDRAAAGRLLEAKNAVEQAVDAGPAPDPALAGRLETLAERLPDASSCEDA